MKKNKKMLGIALAGAMVVMCAVPVKAASTSLQFDNSAYSFGVINRTGSAGVYSAWLAGSNAGAVTKATFSVGNGNSYADVVNQRPLTYGDDSNRGVSFKAKEIKSTITLQGNGTVRATAY